MITVNGEKIDWHEGMTIRDMVGLPVLPFLALGFLQRSGHRWCLEERAIVDEAWVFGALEQVGVELLEHGLEAFEQGGGVDGGWGHGVWLVES